MTALVRSELLKLRTTRTPPALVLVGLALVAVGLAAAIGFTDSSSIREQSWRDDLIGIAGIVTLFAFLVGLLSATTEYRHATITRTFLASPVRRRVVLAKLAGGALVALPLGLATIALTLAIAVPWLSARGAPLEVDRDDLPARFGGLLLATVLWTLLGVVVGVLVRNQVGAIVGTLAWFLVLEPLVTVIRDSVSRYLPGAALEAVSGGESSALLPFWGGLLVTLAYLGALAVVGIVLVERRDVTG